MSVLNYRARVDIGAGLATMAIGAFFATLAARVSPDAYDDVGPRFVPALLAALMIALGALVAAKAWWTGRRPEGTADPTLEACRDADADFGFIGSDIARVALVIGCGAVYVVLFWAVGYFGATLAAMALILLAFGNRSPLRLALIPILAAVAYQYVFVGLMGLYDPAGALLDLSGLTARISGP